MIKEPSLKDLINEPKVSFGKLYKLHKDEFILFARTFSLSETVIMDVYQDAILSFYENVINGKISKLSSSLKTYLFSIGKYKIYEHLREQSKLNLAAQPLKSDIDLDNYDLEPEQLSEREKLVKSNFKKLGKQCQLVLEMFYLRGLTLNDIKTIENYENTNTVKSQKSRCLRKLRALLNL